jgi:predicted Zn-dependent protease
MKKISLLLVLIFLLATGCENKWQGNTSNIPQEVLAEHQALLDENLAALEENPQNSTAAFEVAYRYYMLGDFKGAEEYYLKTVELDPGNFVAYNNLMHLYQKVDEPASAAEMAKYLFNLQPDNAGVLQDVVEVFLQAGEPESAQTSLEYYARSMGDTMTPEQQQLVSDLYQSIVDYRTVHEQQ